MKFLFPTFLFALFSVAIPIIIHLFSFRRYKTVYFSHVGFLKDIKKESKKKSRLKQLLILLARILTLVFLVFAFSQPYIPFNQESPREGQQLIAVYVDNSFSMNALSEQGQLLEVARNKALEICLAYPPGTKFRLYTNDLKPKNQHIFNKEQFIQQVSEIQPSPNVFPISFIYNRFSALKEEGKNQPDKNLYFISDFQHSITDIENFNSSNIFSYFLPLVPNEVANLYIDTCWVEVPAHRLNQEENIFVRIKNSSNQDYRNLPLNLYLNDSIKSITNFSVAANNEITATLKYTNNTAGVQLGKVEITDYPFTYDNNWYLSYLVKPNLKALTIFNNNPDSREGLNYLTALFGDDDYIHLDQTNVRSLQVNQFAGYNTIFIINPENFSSGFLNGLKKAVNSGTSVVVFPKTSGSLVSLNNFLTLFGADPVTGIDTLPQEISGIDFDNTFYKNVFKKREKNAILPTIKEHLKFAENTRSSETRLLWFKNNDKAFSTLPSGKGKVWIFGFPLSKKNESFARDILFVPTLYNIVLNSLLTQKISYTVGKTTFVDLPENEKNSLYSTTVLVNPVTGEESVPQKNFTDHGVRIDFSNLIREAGHYLIKTNGKTSASLAFNYNRKESDLRYFSENELRDKIRTSGISSASVIGNSEKKFTEVFDEMQNGRQLWRWCILFALLFILAEVSISRFWKS
ncbi:MAG: BatA domain-containing protein [Prolixibacteraceae bacterium]|nr:BatA domain-containing protein [Prolixibacteraceae bacterium]